MRPCLAPRIQKTRSPTAPRDPRWLGLRVRRRAWGALERACLVWNTALWGQGLALLGLGKDPLVGMRVQREGRVPGVVR